MADDKISAISFNTHKERTENNNQTSFDRDEYIKKTPLFQIDPNIAGTSAYMN